MIFRSFNYRIKGTQSTNDVFHVENNVAISCFKIFGVTVSRVHQIQNIFLLKYLTDHELHEDGGHPDTVPGTDTLEHVLALGWLGSVLLPDGSELLQHLKLGLPQVGLHVGVPVKINHQY